MKRVLAAPLLHFVVLGTVLFALERLGVDGRALGFSRDPIVVAAPDVERLRAVWLAETGRSPDRAELEATIRRHADEEILFREALRLGLDRTDPVVHSRLVQNLRFVHGDDRADDRAMFAEALALGMNRSDEVVRRRLVQAMEARLAARAQVTRAEAQRYVQAHPARFAGLPRVSFDQVFLGADRHGAGLGAAAAAMASQLAHAPADEIRGEPFLLGRHWVAQSEGEIARNFGAELAHAAMQAPLRSWIGPLRSPYGVHFVRVESRTQAGTADVAAVEREAYYTLLDEREREVTQAGVVALRRAYPLRIEWPELALAGAP